MLGKVIAAAVGTAVIGVAAGAVAGYVVQPDVHTADAATPIAGVKPTAPEPTPTPTYSVSPDIDYPPLQTQTSFSRPLRISNDVQAWTYQRPRSWTARQCLTPPDATTLAACTEVVFRPPSEPVTGGYAMFVKALVGNHDSVSDSVAAKLFALRSQQHDGGIADLDVVEQTDNTLYVTFLIKKSDDSGYLFRYNFFKYFAAPGSSEASLSLSVAGRKQDVEGLYALVSSFTSDARALP